LNYFNILSDKLLYELPVSLEFCYVYDTQEESVNLLMHDHHPYDKKYIYHSKELDQIMHEISLFQIMISQHQKLLGALQCIACTFDKTKVIAFPLKNAVLILAFDKRKLDSMTAAEYDLLIRRLQHIISECGLTPEDGG
jgi:hypothetical protein